MTRSQRQEVQVVCAGAVSKIGPKTAVTPCLERRATAKLIAWKLVLTEELGSAGSWLLSP